MFFILSNLWSQVIIIARHFWGALYLFCFNNLPKIVHYKDEDNIAGGVFPQHRGVFLQIVFKWSLENFPACFRPGIPFWILIYIQPLYSMGSAHIGILFLGVWRINGFYELIFLHEGAIVENLEVYSNEFTPGCGYITTHQFVCCWKGCTLGDGYSIKIGAIPYHS